jgi:hypothetical protein
MKIWIFLLTAVALATSVVSAHIDAPGLHRPPMTSIGTD